MPRCTRIRFFIICFLIFASWLIAADPVTYIQSPLMNRPAIVRPGDEFEIEFTGSGSMTARLQTPYFSKALEVTTVPYDLDGLRHATVRVPADTYFELYDLQLSLDAVAIDTVHHAVRVLSVFREAYYIIHLPDMHLPSCAWFGDYDDPNTVSEVRQLIREFEIINPEFILQTGDVVDNGEQPESYAKAQTLLASLSVPIFISGGNHDLWYDGHENWHTYFGSSMDYSFNYGSHHYAGLEMYDGSYPTFTAAQINWLQQDLKLSVDNGDAFRGLFFHVDQSQQIDNALVDRYDIGLTVFGHLHQDLELSLGSAGIPNLCTSFTMNDRGAYRLIQIAGDRVLDFPLLHFNNLKIDYQPVNDGTHSEVTALISNDNSVGFDNGMVKFRVRHDPSGYSVSGGNVVQVVETNDVDLYYVQVDIPANSGEMTVRISSNTDPNESGPVILSASLAAENTIMVGDIVNCHLELATNGQPDFTWQLFNEFGLIESQTSTDFNYQTSAADYGELKLTVTVDQNGLSDYEEFFLFAGKLSSIPEVNADINNFLPYDDWAEINWTEPHSMNLRLEYGQIPGDYSEGSIPETSTEGVRFIPQNEGMTLGRYYCRLTDGSVSSRSFTIIVAASTAPKMISPIGDIKSLSPYFSWERVPGVPYYFVVVSDEEIVVRLDENNEYIVEGANPIWAAIVDGNSVPYGAADLSENFVMTPPALLAGDSYWWVVLNAYGPEAEMVSEVLAGIAKFTVDIPLPALSPPMLVSPEDNASISSDRITFRWDRVTGASAYRLYPYRIESADGIEVNRPYWKNLLTTTDDYFTYPAKELLVGGNYQWRVAAVDAAGREVQSEYRKFVYDIPVALVDVFTYDSHGTPNFTDDEKLPRTNIDYLTMNGVPAGLSLATDLHANLYDVQMAPGTYIFIASKEGYASERDTVTLAAGDDIKISFRLSPNPALVHGRVLDETGAPVFNADVSCIHTLLNELVYLFQTDAAGYFNAVLPAGTWRLSGMRTGYKNSRIVNLTVHTDEEMTLPEPLVLEQIKSRISGKIINASNQPVSGATISVSHQDISISTLSDAAGLFALSVLPGTWAVAVQKDGYAVPPVFEITVGDGQQYTISPSITLTPNPGYVRGMVTDGQKIMANVVVRAIPPAGGFIQTTTDDFGQFSLNLTTGNYQLMALLAGYENAVGPQINISSGQTVAGIVLVLTPMAGQISGKATTDGTTPLANVKISNESVSTFTSTNGTYVLQLPSGSTVLSATLSGYLAEADQAISMAPGQMLENINFILAPNASVFKGNVLSGTEALAGASVTAEMGDAVFKTLTDDAGAFVLSVSAGIWTIRVEKSGFFAESILDITIGPGQTLVNLNFDLMANSAILSGWVKDTGSKPVPEAIVRILETITQTTTQSDGSFSLTLEPGDYQVQAFKEGSAPSPIKDISLTAGGTLSNVLLNLVSGYRLSGKISDSAGVPVSAAIIISDKGQATASLTDGSYSLYLPYGKHLISVSKPGYSSVGGKEIDMLQEKSDVNFILTPEFSGFAGTVVDAVTGNGLTMATVQLAGAALSATALTDEEGRFNFLDPAGNHFLPAGSYELTISKTAFERHSEIVEFTAGTVLSRDYQLNPQTGEISGLVTAAGLALPAATIQAVHSITNSSYSTVSDNNGNFVLGNLPVGTYSVTAFKTDYESPAAIEMSTGDAAVLIQLIPYTGMISGTISDVDNAPLTGVMLSLTDGEGYGREMNSADSDFFQFDKLPQHDFTISARKEGYANKDTSGVPGDGSVIMLQMVPLSGTIYVIVQNETGGLVAGVAIIMRGKQNSWTQTTAANGATTFADIAIGEYTLQPMRIGWLSNPASISVTVTENGDHQVFFQVVQADAVELNIEGPDEISNAAAIQFNYLAHTEDGQETTILAAWSVLPESAADINASSGQIDVNPDFIGTLELQVQDQNNLDLTARKTIQVFQALTPQSPQRELKGSGGLELGFPAGCVPTEIHLAHSFSGLPDAQTAMDSLQLLGRIHDIKPFGIPLKNRVRLQLPVADGVGALSRPLNKPQSAFSMPLDATEYVAGFWNPTTLEWEIMPVSGANTEYVTIEVDQLGRYAVFQASEPLGVRDVKFSANPFSPEIAPLEIRYQVTSSTSTILWVTVRIYTMTGDPVAVLAQNEPQNKGANSVVWDGTTTNGGNGLNGRYVVQIKVKDDSGEKEILKSVVLIK